MLSVSLEKAFGWLTHSILISFSGLESLMHMNVGDELRQPCSDAIGMVRVGK